MHEAAVQQQQASPPAELTYMFAFLEAINNTNESETQMQLTDANTTEFDANMESSAYTYWNGILTTDAGNIQTDVDNKDTTQMNADQAAYSTASAEAQSFESQLDGTLQTAQGQTQGDAQNLLQWAQMASSVTGIQETLARFLGSLPT